MRRPRLFVHDTFPETAYHIVSRVSHRLRLFEDEEKAMLVSLMRRYARFCGIRVLTYCMMGNHFHWLLEVEERPVNADQMSDAELVERVRRCHGKQVAAMLQAELESLLLSGNTLLHAHIRGKYLKRMWNLSAFVQSVKQRFTVWFNRRHKRKGTLWEERFKSVVAMGPEAVASVAAYIDLNPVRAGLVEDPADYRWSGYGEALSGGKGAKEAQRGLQRALCDREGSVLSNVETRKRYLEWYRCWIYGRGEARGLDANGKPMKPGFAKAEVVKELEDEGRIPAVEQLTRTVRHFTDGLVLGTGALLTAVFEAQRAYFGPKRKSGPRKMRGGDWGPLRAMRDLQRLSEN
jgi:REP element-mobilizing transposase RayT